MQYDAFGQPLGRVVDNWQAATYPQVVTLVGRTCRLEPFDRGRHGESLRAALALDRDGRDWAYLMPAPVCDADWQNWFTMMSESRDPLFFAIVDQVSGEAIGSASYLRIDAANGVVEIGWLRFSPRLQRSTAATEAMFLMLQQAFDWGYRRIEWKCNALNAPSMRAAERLGFTFEGTFRQARVNWGRNRDTAWFSMLDHEWPQNAAAFATWLAADNFDPAGQQRHSLQACRQSLRSTGEVRRATLADLPQLATLFDGYRRFYEQQDDAANSRDFIRARLVAADSHIMVYERAGQLQGFVQLYPLFSSLSTGRLWLLSDLFVSPAARRDGIGRQLMLAAAALARQHGVSALELSTAHTNQQAQALYESLGWQLDREFRYYTLSL